MGEEEFDAFFAVSYSRVVGQLYALTGDWAEAQEGVLEAFVRAWDHRSHFDLEGAPDSWIRTVSWHLANSRRRFGREPAAAGTAAGAERVEFVEVLRGLSEQQRRVTVLHDLCDLGVEEVAAEAGVSVDAVRAGLARSGAQRHRDLVDELYDFANRHAHPRLTAPQVRALADRRRLGRRSAAVGGVSALALAGVIVVALLAGRPDSPTVLPSAGHPTGVHRVAAGHSPS
ncbi:MAG TPA: sigma factor [Actinospica sp.]|nr:sigma factor [Actinospica sp.]